VGVTVKIPRRRSENVPMIALPASSASPEPARFLPPDPEQHEKSQGLPCCVRLT
jgi:hypothetical protein